MGGLGGLLLLARLLGNGGFLLRRDLGLLLPNLLFVPCDRWPLAMHACLQLTFVRPLAIRLAFAGFQTRFLSRDKESAL